MSVKHHKFHEFIEFNDTFANLGVQKKIEKIVSRKGWRKEFGHKHCLKAHSQRANAKEKTKMFFDVCRVFFDLFGLFFHLFRFHSRFCFAWYE